MGGRGAGFFKRFADWCMSSQAPVSLCSILAAYQPAPKLGLAWCRCVLVLKGTRLAGLSGCVLVVVRSAVAALCCYGPFVVLLQQ
jgi:hypothetical protein